MSETRGSPRSESVCNYLKKNQSVGSRRTPTPTCSTLKDSPTMKDSTKSEYQPWEYVEGSIGHGDTEDAKAKAPIGVAALLSRDMDTQYGKCIFRPEEFQACILFKR